MRVLLVGGGAREHAIAKALVRSARCELFVIASNGNPGLVEISTQFVQEREENVHRISRWANKNRIEMAVIGPEGPLAFGLADILGRIEIPVIGPQILAAQLEASKLFLRQVMDKYKIPGQVEWHHFRYTEPLRSFLRSSTKEYAVKPIGLTTGKGVKVMGVHLSSVEDAIAYGKQVLVRNIGGNEGVLLEERLVGEEFTLQAFVDGNTVTPMPLVRDFKRAYEGDTGPNTGSMGSYSLSNGLLPFVTSTDYNQAFDILKRLVQAVVHTIGHQYKGILYGQFMMTDQGVKLVEINVRFGDPEALNVLTLLENDFLEICLAISNGTLGSLKVGFKPKATVCKYVTPPGYPENPKVGVPIRLDLKAISDLSVEVFFARVEAKGTAVLTTQSRSFALVGTGDTIQEAESSVEQALTHVHGKFHVRHDIGKN